MDKLFFDLRASHNPHRWFMPVTPDICVGRPDDMFMFGGVGLASAVAAMERTCDRPVIWATAQYLSFARPGNMVDLDVWTPASGKYTTQARVVGHVNDKEIFTVAAALGERPSPYSQQWLTAPDVAPPEDCDVADHWCGGALGLHTRIETRVAGGRYGFGASGEPAPDGRTLLWIRSREGFAVDASLLAIMADFVPSGVGGALGKMAGGTSLDNTLRVRRIVPTEWVLCEIRIDGVHGGFAHGSMALFAQDGELMATASQSLVVRVREDVTDR